MKEISTQTYSLEVPDEWETQSTEEGLVSIYDPSGRGAITVSSYSSETGALDIIHELKKFARKDIVVEKKQVDGQEVALAEYEDHKNGDIVFTLSMVIARSSNFLLASYHCNKIDVLSTELEIVKKIFATITLI